jgi:AraC family transcriptional regulator of adaptative response/methylated-DNA-[protein]-cysteine methyltransferase
MAFTSYARSEMEARTRVTIEPDSAWAAVMGRDGQRDGTFVYAVTTTGVYCRPSCPSRRPHRQNVLFFDAPDAAEHAGFRACRRCKPRDAAAPTTAMVDKVRTYVETHLDDRVTLSDLARHVGVSTFHLQRTFKRETGLSPAQYAAARRAERFRHELKQGANVTRATYDAGYSSSSRLYAVSNAQLGMTPSTYRRGGHGMHIRYATANTAFGRLLVAATERGVCFVELGDDDRTLEAGLAAEYPLATRAQAPTEMGKWMSAVLATLDGAAPRAVAAQSADPGSADTRTADARTADAQSAARRHTTVPLDVKATDFKWRVWRALQEIPYGETRTYAEVAAAIGAPRAVRAVANACATNNAALVIPCHRVIGSNGTLTGYRWGVERKRQLLEHERAQAARRGDASGSGRGRERAARQS